MDTDHPTVFICYAREDLATAKKFYKELKRAGVSPWMDKEDLLPGQAWKPAITQAIRNSRFVIVLLSTSFVSTRGYRQKELKHALAVLEEMPDGQIFLIPARLEDCVPTNELLLDLNWVDLFPDSEYPEGVRKILKVVCPEPSPPPAPPVEYIENKYEDQGEVIFDRATGLMWQTSGSGRLPYEKTAGYIQQLNDKRFAGYNDWRLPTVKELTSLLELKKSSHGLYLNPIFDKKQNHCWSADTRLPGSASVVYFDDRNVLHQRDLNHKLYIRAVRSIKEQEPPRQVKEAPKVTLRSKPLTVYEEESKQGFELDDNFNPLTYIENEYEDQGDVILDHATGLMWQTSGSDWVTYEKAQAYVDSLNTRQFAGYTDWRLPTVPELMSLLEPKKQSNKLFMNPLFNGKQVRCWSADKCLSEGGSRSAAWLVRFDRGGVRWGYLVDESYVRAVRSMTK